MYEIYCRVSSEERQATPSYQLASYLADWFGSKSAQDVSERLTVEQMQAIKEIIATAPPAPRPPQ